MKDKPSKTSDSSIPINFERESPGIGPTVKNEKPTIAGETLQDPAKPGGESAKPGEPGFDASQMYRCQLKDEKTGLVCGRMIKNDREAIREHERRVHGIKVNKTRKKALVVEKPEKPVIPVPIESTIPLEKVVVPAVLPEPGDIGPKKPLKQENDDSETREMQENEVSRKVIIPEIDDPIVLKAVGSQALGVLQCPEEIIKEIFILLDLPDHGPAGDHWQYATAAHELVLLPF